jgi:OTU domain-containing protein 6
LSDAVESHGTTPDAAPVIGESCPLPATEKTADEMEREKKLAKARQKREKAKQNERDRELEIERENANAGPSLRQIELERIQQQLTPLGLEIVEILSDGHCLYRAVAAHCGKSYQEIRKLYLIVATNNEKGRKSHSSHAIPVMPGTLCADTLLKNETEFAPFCEYEDGKVSNFADYVERVRNSSDWGGHLELRALSLALRKQIVVYSAQSMEPLLIQPDDGEGVETDDPIRLSYHLNYYALGEHYNQVVKVPSS